MFARGGDRILFLKVWFVLYNNHVVLRPVLANYGLVKNLLSCYLSVLVFIQLPTEKKIAYYRNKMENDRCVLKDHIRRVSDLSLVELIGSLVYFLACHFFCPSPAQLNRLFCLQICKMINPAAGTEYETETDSRTLTSIVNSLPHLWHSAMDLQLQRA